MWEYVVVIVAEVIEVGFGVVVMVWKCGQEVGWAWISSSSSFCGVWGEVLGSPQRMAFSSWKHVSLKKKSDGEVKNVVVVEEKEKGIGED